MGGTRGRNPFFRIGATFFGRALGVGVLGVCVASLGVSAAFATDATAQPKAQLPGHVLPVLVRASSAPTVAAAQGDALTLTLVLKRDDEAGFQAYLRDVYDANSANFRRFLSQAELRDRFGPSQAGYEAVLDYARTSGLAVVAGSRNRMTLTVSGSRAAVERAFDIDIGDYTLEQKTFYANDRDPSLPAAIAAHVQAIHGLSNVAQPQPQREVHILLFSTVCALTAFANFEYLNAAQGSAAAQAAYLRAFAKCVNANGASVGYGKLIGIDPPAPAWQGVDGSGQQIGLLEFDNFVRSDVADYIRLIDLPDAEIDKVTAVAVNGGTAAGANQDEVLLDIADVLSIAPGADIGVYHAPFAGGASFQALFNAMIDDGVSIISNSWAYCEDQTSAADVQSIDAILETAAASGISVFSGSGDTGSACLDGAANTAAVPASAPHLTAVGGTSLDRGQGYTYGSETWWDGSGDSPPSGQGGYGTSRFFARPDYQNALNAGTMRSLPDVAANADPAHGIEICAAALGGCPTGASYGGTSSSTPMWAAFTALLNQAQGQNLGWLNPQLYALAGTDAFHTPASMGSDFAHVGLGSPNLARLHQRLTNQTPGAPSASVSEAHAYGTDSFTFPADLELPVFTPADGASQAWIVVRAADANGNLIGGAAVTLAANAGNHAVITPPSANTNAQTGSAVFAVTDNTPEDLVFTVAAGGVALAATPRISFTTPSAASASIMAFPTSVAADGNATTSITVTLRDAQNRPTPGKSIELAQDGRSVTSAPMPAVTDANGQIVFTASDTFEETVTYTAVDASDGDLPIPGTAVVTFSGSAAGSCAAIPSVLGDYVLTSYINGFDAYPFFFGNTTYACTGASDTAFDASGNAYLSDVPTGGLYRFGADGGAATAPLSNLGPSLGTPVFDTDGRMYAPHGATTGDFTTGDIVEIDPVTGAQLRVVASNLTCPNGLAFDPLSGDLFFDDNCTGAGSDNPSLFRLIDPAGTDPDRPTEVTVYATLPGTPNGLISFSPDGTIYVATIYPPYQCVQPSDQPILRVSGTDGPSPATVTPLDTVGSCFFVRVGAVDANGAARSLLVENHDADGNFNFLNLVDLTTTPPTQTPLAKNLNTGTIGADGCLYVSNAETIYKLTPADGHCTFAATNPSPALALTPRIVAPDPLQGGNETLTATFSNIVVPADTPVFFEVRGANARSALVRSDAAGVAELSYQGTFAGDDVITATATVDGVALTSNASRVHWSAGPHQTFLSFVGATGAPAGVATVVQASLTDVAETPQLALAGAGIHFTLAGASCDAITAANGVAGCSLTVATPGAYTLTASYAGTAAHLPATASTLFVVPVDGIDRIFADGFDGG